MTEKLIEILAQNGPFAVISGVLVYLYIRLFNKFDTMHKSHAEMMREQLQAQVADTASKTTLTQALEDVVETVEALGENAAQDVGACRSKVGVLMKKMEDYLEERRIEKAREEGRREATNPRLRIPTGDSDDPQGK